MNEGGRLERVRRALGAARIVALSSGAARGPLDLLRQRDAVARLLDAEAERRGVIVLSTPPAVFDVASLRAGDAIEVVPSGSS